MPITIVNTNYTITDVKNTTFPFAYLIKYYNMKSQDLFLGSMLITSSFKE